jgi:hypothetical protein
MASSLQGGWYRSRQTQGDLGTQSHGLGTQAPVSRVAAPDRSAMLSFVRRRTSALMEGLLVAVIAAMLAGLTALTAFAMAAPGTSVVQQTLEGVLSVRHGDNFTNGKMVGHAYFLNDFTPDVILIMPWNLRDEIAGQLGDARSWGARLVVAIP